MPVFLLLILAIGGAIAYSARSSVRVLSEDCQRIVLDEQDPEKLWSWMQREFAPDYDKAMAGGVTLSDGVPVDPDDPYLVAGYLFEKTVPAPCSIESSDAAYQWYFRLVVVVKLARGQDPTLEDLVEGGLFPTPPGPGPIPLPPGNNLPPPQPAMGTPSLTGASIGRSVYGDAASVAQYRNLHPLQILRGRR